jgi:hypothetical protein
MRWPWWLINLYAENIVGLMAEEQIARIQAADMPHMDTSDRKSVIRALERRTEYAEQTPDAEQVPDLSTPSGQARAGAVGIGVRVVKVES